MPIAEEFKGMIRAPNGMEVAVLPFAQKSRIYIWLCLKTGSLDGFVPLRGKPRKTDITCQAMFRGREITLVHRPGIDHAVEHLVFKGTTDPKYRTAYDINEYYAPRNRDDIEAHGADTAELTVRYYVETEPEGLEESFRFLGALTLRSLLNAKDPRVWKYLLREWVKEQNVVRHERAFGNDDAELVSQEAVLRMMFPLHPLQYSVDGTTEEIASIKRWEIAARYHARYHPSNMLLIVIGGGITRQMVRKLVGKYFRTPRRKTLYIPSKTPILPENIPLKDRVKFLPKDREKTYIAISFPFTRPATTWGENSAPWLRKHFGIAILQKFFGGRWASEPFIELREKRGIGYRHNALRNGFPGAGTLLYGTHLFPDEVEKALRILIQIYRRLTARPVEEKKFAYAQSSLIDELEAARETPGDLAEYIYSWQRLAGRVPMFDELKKEILAVTREDVLAVAREILVPERLYGTFVGNIPSENFQKRVLRILRTWKAQH